jgi:putative peptidoglycan lipid II flippase
MVAWLEFALLRRTMNRRIGRTGLPISYTAKVWSIAIAAAAFSFAVKYWVTKGLSPLISGIIVLLTYGLVYFGGSIAARIPEALQLVDALRKKSEARSRNNKS